MPEPPAPAKYMPARKPVKMARPFALLMIFEGILPLSMACEICKAVDMVYLPTKLLRIRALFSHSSRRSVVLKRPMMVIGEGGWKMLT
jgi:hypothetical protein